MTKIVVDKNTSCNTISKALKILENSKSKLDETVEIQIKKGIYFEKIKLNLSNLKYKEIKIIGESKKKTIISFNDHALKIHPDGSEFNTFRTYTMLIIGSNVTIENLTIENTSGSGKKYGQAVALSVIGDMININNCRLIANQDTLFLGPLPKDLIERYQNFLPKDELIYPKLHRVYCSNCYIQGDVDFVFGGAEAYFDNCEFFSNNKKGYIFAPSTEKDEQIGFIVRNSCFTSSSQKEQVYLARPWRDYGMVALFNCQMGNHIFDMGFDKWNNTNRDKTCRFYEYQSTYFDKHNYKRCSFVNTKDKLIIKDLI